MISEAKKLEPLLAGIDFTATGELNKCEITGLSSDSRTVAPGNLFAAIEGFSVDGHNFLEQAAAAGCCALLVNRGRPGLLSGVKARGPLVIVEVEDTKTALGLIAANYFDHPDREMTMIGITGTNGKTTTSFLVESVLKTCGRRPGVIGTVNYRFTDKKNRHIELPAPFTTPESPALFALLRRMADEQITDVVMEVSSHALAQSRLSGIGFDIGAFTNLSRDHLDFHADMQHYFFSKKLLFTRYLKPEGRVVLVLENKTDSGKKCTPAETESDGWSRRMHEGLRDFYRTSERAPRIITCGMEDSCDIYPDKFSRGIRGIQSVVRTPAGSLPIKSPLVGEFNLRNILCAIGIGMAHNEEPGCIQQGVERVENIPGRLERVVLKKEDIHCPAVFVDYAHSPDALENVLQTLLELKPGRIVCVFGCGGDRDRGKRAPMGEIAGRLCDVVLATSDNPRSESPEAILAQIEKGLGASGLERVPASEILHRQKGRGYDIIVNRHLAIRTAIRFSRPGDVILISGKGHENYQTGRKGKAFFDDRIEAEMHLAAKSGAPMTWKLDWVRQITGAHLQSPVHAPLTFNNISTDSRTIKSGDLFVALRGEKFDGRDFASAAVANGAAGLLVNYDPEMKETVPNFKPAVPVLQVPDTLTALGQLAGSLRRWYKNLLVIAITGSSGKTTVKEMTGAILRQKHDILMTEGNFNNLIGLPLTLFRLKPEHDIAVLEMGMNHPGEIASLTETAGPDIACITNVQEAHLEGLGDLDGVARAKNELFAGVGSHAKIAVNLDDVTVCALAARLSQAKITFGLHPEAFIRADKIISLGSAGMEFTLHIGPESCRTRIRALGSHNVTNSLAAAAMAHAAGAAIEEIAAGLATFKPFDKRARVEELPSGLMVLNDCYNANPSSMLAALKTVRDLKKEHRAVAVLGGMLELGQKTDSAHRTLGRQVGELGLDFLAAFGPQAENLISGAIDAGLAPAAARAFDRKDDLAIWIKGLQRDNKIGAGDWLLLKGSRGMRMEEILDLLRHNNFSMKAAGN